MLITGVSLFLSMQKTGIETDTRKIVRTSYAVFFPVTVKQDIASCNRITIYYERSKNSRGIETVSIDTRSEFFEIQFRSASGEPISLLEFSEYKPTAELAGKLSQQFNLPVEDLYKNWLNQVQENREKRRRAGFR
ncbi:MAG: hypothetical protein ACRC3B_19470 [Bacteroidia bacterium]